MSEGTAKGFVAVTLSDTVDIAVGKDGNFPRALRFGTGGTAVIIGIDGTSATFTNIADGETLQVGAKRIMSAGSSGVANIVGLY